MVDISLLILNHGKVWPTTVSILQVKWVVDFLYLNHESNLNLSADALARIRPLIAPWEYRGSSVLLQTVLDTVSLPHPPQILCALVKIEYYKM